jgi:farnesyl diphosphate synthase/geranylgeranyl diphosphate synthase type II
MKHLNPTADFEQFLAHCQQKLATQLPLLMAANTQESDVVGRALIELAQASQYSLLNGGKRVRPVLVYAAAQAVGPVDKLTALDYAAAAIEMLHTYSLVHDDLPAMDDDDLRRGQPTCHRAYSEALAILVGDTLQARAFELLATAPGTDDSQKVHLIQTLAHAAGSAGMVGGQAVDIAATNKRLDLTQLQTMHGLKTGALIRAAVALGAVTARASDKQLEHLDSYGKHIGLAFQVVDDVLDVEGTSQSLGKTSGKDSEANKSTYVSLLGLEGAKAAAEEQRQAALECIGEFDGRADHLRNLATYITARTH